MRGPAAPKDPVEKRSGLYVILDKTIAGRKESDGVVRDHIYLEGRLRGQVQFTSGEVEETILDHLATVESIRKLVHSISVTILAADEENKEKEAEFQVECYGKSDKYSTGTHMEMVIPCTGEEMVMPLDAYPVNPEDTVLGAFNITLPVENKNFIVTVKFYLNDGFEVPEIHVDPPIKFESEEYKKMIAHSLVSTGNNYRLKRVIERAKAGEDVTIAYIGGSITQGAGAKPINTMCYSYRAYQSFCKMFSPCQGKNIHYVKAGVGGTSSELGMIRYENDVLKNGVITPDLVIVEFAVNDEGDETKGVCFESLIKKILMSENRPAVLLNFAVFMNDWNLQDRLQPIGERYEVPMVSVKDAVSPQFGEKAVITKRQYFYDIFHPTNDGHHIMADCIAYLFETVDKETKADHDITLDKPPVYGTQFTEVERFDRKNAADYCEVQQTGFDGTDLEVQYVERDMDLNVTPVFKDNWMKSENTKACFSFHIACKNLLLVMKDSGDSRYGKADVFVDGVLKCTLDPLKVGWNHSTAILLIDEKETRDHEVRIQMHPGDEAKKFTIQGFGVTK